MTATASVQAHLDSSVPARQRVGFVDGLRGIAALYVVVAHALAINMPVTATASGGIYGTGSLWDRALYLVADASIVFSRYGVVLFIVLSGCSLMLPIARSEDGRLPGGLWMYVRRRARRILPPYYAAVLLSLGLIAVVPGMATASIAWWEGALPAWDLDVLLSHALLIHNLSPDWAYRINPPLWTIPIEWQIYFVFPIVLLPVWRRYRETGAIVVAFAIGLAIYVAAGPDRMVHSAPWFLGLFALGMAAAVFGFSRDRPGPIPQRWLLPVVGMALGAFLLAAAIIRLAAIEFAMGGWIADVIFGFATAVFVVYCARDGEHRLGHARRFLGARPVVTLGWFSYSLYLVHAPILVVIALGFRAVGIPPALYVPAVVAGIIIAVVAAWAFHLVFERPFMPRHLRDVGAPVRPGPDGTPAGQHHHFQRSPDARIQVTPVDGD